MSVAVAERKAIGRPSMYTPELADEICRRLSASSYGLREVCQADDMPDQSTICDWVRKHESFAQAYAQARENLGHNAAELAVEHALTATDAQLGRLKYDASKWFASKLTPKVYGEASQVRLADHKGDALDGGAISEVMAMLRGAQASRSEAIAAPTPVIAPPTRRVASRAAPEGAEDLV